MKIKKVPEIGKYRPPCRHKVRVSDLETHTRSHRLFVTRKLDIPLDQCGLGAVFLIDDLPVCRAHAGDMSLRYLMDKTEKSDEC